MTAAELERLNRTLVRHGLRPLKRIRDLGRMKSSPTAAGRRVDDSAQLQRLVRTHDGEFRIR